MANAETDAALAPIPQSPTGLAVLPQVLIKIATVIVGLAAVAMSALAVLPPFPWTAAALAVCGSIVGLGATLGISSQGIRKDPAPK